MTMHAAHKIKDPTLEEFENAQLSNIEPKVVLVISILWFKREFIQLVDEANKWAEAHLRSELRKLARGGEESTAQSLIRRTSKYGPTTMLSPDEKTSISLCGNFIETRCGDLGIPVARDNIQSLMDLVFKVNYPANSGMTFEIQGVTAALPKFREQKVLTERLLKGHSRTRLENDVLGTEIDNASIRLFFRRGVVKYTVDVGPDAARDIDNKGPLFVRQRSIRNTGVTPKDFQDAMGKDIDLWNKIGRKLVQAFLRGD